MDSNIGKKLDGRYELLELIGVGGMADIYRARDIVEDRIVAVKILKTEFAAAMSSCAASGTNLRRSRFSLTRTS